MERFLHFSKRLVIVTGSWDEDSTSILATYETLANTCELSEEEKLRAMPIILDGDALDYFSSKILPQSSATINAVVK